MTDEHLIRLNAQLTQLQALYLEGSTLQLTTIGVKKILPLASKLSLLHLKYINHITINKDDYKELLEIVKKRPNNTKLKIQMVGSGVANVSDVIMSENRNFLHIDEEILW